MVSKFFSGFEKPDPQFKCQQCKTDLKKLPKTTNLPTLKLVIFLGPWKLDTINKGFHSKSQFMFYINDLYKNTT